LIVVLHQQCLEMSHRLVLARQTATCVTAPSAVYDEVTLEDAYLVARCLEDEWSKDGHQANGVKLGLTDVSKWPALGINNPTWGRTYVDTTTESTSASIKLDQLVSPRIEAEVVVGLARALVPNASPDNVVDAIGWVALGFEVVDCHVGNWNVTAADLIADFGAHAGLIIGPRHVLRRSEILMLQDLSVRVTNRSAEIAQGKGHTVAGGPVQAIVAFLSAPHATSLSAGTLISTGALTGSHALAEGDHWSVSPFSGPLTPVSLTVVSSGRAR
jgi:2-keto-4-pentenoate hydratase